MRLLTTARTAVGLAELVTPEPILERVLRQPLDGRTLPVLRLLGGRHLVQALITARRPSARVVRLGVAVDALHALSMVGLGLSDAQRRRIALTSAGVATAFAVAGTVSARGVAPRRAQAL